jgi:hypothetical protein
LLPLRRRPLAAVVVVVAAEIKPQHPRRHLHL